MCAALLIAAATGCAESASTTTQALRSANDWFARAASGARTEEECHGLGLLKHPQFTCAEYLDHASRVDAATREVQAIVERDAFGGVQGTFYDITFNARDTAGNEIVETIVLKRDDGRSRVYWYRTDSLLALLKSEARDPTDDVDPQQAAYDEIVARYPSLYQYPPCYQVRPSSANLVGELTAKDAIDVQHVEILAQTCGATFCFALVGEKIATLCPPSS